MRKKWRVAWVVAAVVVAALVLGCGIYVADYYRADQTAMAAMAGNEIVEVVKMDDMAAFMPKEPTAGFIFYPGGKVEYTAYAPLMLSLAERGMLCIVVEMPFNLAVLDMDAAEGIAQAYPDIGDWYIGGHSLGGSMAAGYAAENTENFSGLILLAAYSTAEITELDVLSLYGSEDGVLNMDKYESYYENLPESTTEIVIQGGNHACFGSYGPQSGDGEAEIDADEQVRITADTIMEWINGSRN